MNFTRKDEVIAFWLTQVGSAIIQRCGCRYFPELEISKAGIVARRSNFLVASTVRQLHQTLFESGDELSVYWG